MSESNLFSISVSSFAHKIDIMCIPGTLWL